MAASNSVQPQAHQSNYQRAILEKIEDPVSYELMTMAVTIVPCGHTLNENTVTQCLAHNKLCPIDRQPIERYIPNYTVRHLAETADSPPQEEESYSPEAETHFLKGKKASDEGDAEGAIEALLEALRLSPCYEKAQAYLEFCLKKAHPPSTTSASPENTREKREEKETKTSCGKEAYIEYLLRLFEDPVIMSHPFLSQILEKEVEQLMDQKGVELSKISLEKYKWAKKLLIDKKVSSFVAKKLQQLSLSSTSIQEGAPQSLHSGPPAPHVVTQSNPNPFSPSAPPISSPTPNPTPVYSSPIIAPTSSVPEMAFGKAKWGKYFGDIGTEPPLPPNIEQILNSACIFYPGEKIRETHLLVLIPNTVNGRAFHLNSLSELIKSPKTGNKSQYRNYNSYVKNELGTKSTGSHWALMTRDVIPDSRNKTYDDQKALVARHVQKSKIPYELPTALDAATAILMHYVETGKALYTDDKLGKQWTYTRCQEKVNKNKWPAAIGGFSSGGLHVCHYFDHSCSGVGCLRKF